jgi:hypothetical protein
VAVTANWFQDLGPTVEGDPLGPRVADVGRPIDLTGDEPRLSEHLVALLGQEGDLAAAGTTCALKEHRDMTCMACPLRHTDPLDTMTPLCSIGVQMERTLTALVVARAKA